MQNITFFNICCLSKNIFFIALKPRAINSHDITYTTSTRTTQIEEIHMVLFSLRELKAKTSENSELFIILKCSKYLTVFVSLVAFTICLIDLD